MRQILFRGKRVDGGGWVEGSYIQTGGHGNVPTITNHTAGQIYPHSYFEIIPESLGQYTGLKDKTDRMIFEGDIMVCNDVKYSVDTHISGAYKLHNPSEHIKDHFLFHEHKIVVQCGTIHDTESSEGE